MDIPYTCIALVMPRRKRLARRKNQERREREANDGKYYCV